jgi:hypothetical protein
MPMDEIDRFPEATAGTRNAVTQRSAWVRLKPLIDIDESTDR